MDNTDCPHCGAPGYGPCEHYGMPDEIACLKRQLAAANERANRYHRDAQKMSAALTAKMEATTGHSFGRTLANVGYHAERLRRIDTEAELREANERAGRLEEERGQLREAWSIINSEAIDEYAETLTHIVAARAMLNAALVEVPDAL